MYEKYKERAEKLIDTIKEIENGLTKEDACKKVGLELSVFNKFVEEDNNFESIRDLKVEELGIRTQACNLLKDAGLYTLGDILDFYKKYDLRCLTGVGNATVNNIVTYIEVNYGIDISFISKNGHIFGRSDVVGKDLHEFPLALLNLSVESYTYTLDKGYKTIGDIVDGIHSNKIKCCREFEYIPYALRRIGICDDKISEYEAKCEEWSKERRWRY